MLLKVRERRLGGNAGFPRGGFSGVGRFAAEGVTPGVLVGEDGDVGWVGGVHGSDTQVADWLRARFEGCCPQGGTRPEVSGGPGISDRVAAISTAGDVDIVKIRSGVALAAIGASACEDVQKL